MLEAPLTTAPLCLRSMIKRAYESLWALARPEFSAKSRLLIAPEERLVRSLIALFPLLNKGAEAYLFKAIRDLEWINVVHKGPEASIFRFRVDPKTWTHTAFLSNTHTYDGYAPTAVYRDLVGAGFDVTIRERRWPKDTARKNAHTHFKKSGISVFLTLLVRGHGATSNYEYDTKPECWRSVVACVFELERRGLVVFLGEAEEPYAKLRLVADKLDEAPEYLTAIQDLLETADDDEETPPEKPDEVTEALIAELERAAAHDVLEEEDVSTQAKARRDIREDALRRLKGTTEEVCADLRKPGETTEAMHARHDAWLNDTVALSSKTLRAIAHSLEHVLDPSLPEDDSADLEAEETLLELRLRAYIEESRLEQRISRDTTVETVLRNVAKRPRVDDIARPSLEAMALLLAPSPDRLSDLLILRSAEYERAEGRLLDLEEDVRRLRAIQTNGHPDRDLQRTLQDLRLAEKTLATLQEDVNRLLEKLAAFDQPPSTA